MKNTIWILAKFTKLGLKNELESDTSPNQFELVKSTTILYVQTRQVSLTRINWERKKHDTS